MRLTGIERSVRLLKQRFAGQNLTDKFPQGVFPFLCLWIGFFLRFYRLGKPEFWADEAASEVISRLPLSGILSYSFTHLYEHPPLYYSLLHLWRGLVGDSEWSLRALSALLGVLAIICPWPLLKRWGGKSTALLGTALMAFFPISVALSQETRMYTLVMALGALVTWSLCKVLEDSGWPWALAYLGFAWIGLATHYLFVWVLVAHLIYAALVTFRKREKGRREASLFLLPLAGISPLLAGWVLIPSLSTMTIEELCSPVLMLPWTEQWRISLTGFSLVGEPRLLPSPLPLPVASAIAVTWVTAMLGVILALRSRRTGSTLALLWWITPVIGILVIQRWARGRYLACTLPPFLLFVAIGLQNLWRRQRVAGVMASLLIGLNIGYGLWALYTLPKGAFGQASRYILENARPGDAVILSFPMADVLAAHYLSSDELTFYKLPEKLSFIPSEQHIPTEQEIETKAKEIFSQHPRVWLGPFTPSALDPEGKIERWLSENAFQVAKVWFPQSTFVALYLPPWPISPPSVRSYPAPTGAVNAASGPYQVFLPLILRSEKMLLAVPFGVKFGDVALLEQACFERGLFPAGSGIRLALTWRILQHPRDEILVSLWLEDTSGVRWAQRVTPMQGGLYPSFLWQPGRTVEDHHGLWIAEGTPPGDYAIWLGLYKPQLNLFIPVQGQEAIKLGEIKVLPGPLPSPAVAISRTFESRLTLLGADRWPQEVHQGKVLPITFYWLPRKSNLPDLRLRLALVDKRGQVQSTGEKLLKSSCWREGVPIRSTASLPIPGRLRPGVYSLEGILLQEDGSPWPEGAKPWELGTIRIRLIPRSFHRPRPSHPMNVVIQGVAKLIGYKLEPEARVKPGDTLHLTLYWQAIGEPDTPYTVFTHLVGPDGKIWGQKDNPPVRGSRPTTTWVEGEYIADEYLIPVSPDAPAGEYTLYVGMYEPVSGQRLPAFDSQGNRYPSDAISVASIRID